MKRNGFTLIEILVVIAIIASIIAIAIPNFLSARQRAQDVKTKSEMLALKDALRLYYNDYSKYPGVFSTGKIKGCGVLGDQNCDRTTVCTTVDFAAGGTGCDNIYMKQLPAGLGSTMVYQQAAGGDDFCIRGTLNNISDPDLATSQARCAKYCSATCTVGSNRFCACAD